MYYTFISNLRRIINFPRRGIGQTSIDKIIMVSNKEGISLWEVLEKSSEELKQPSLYRVLLINDDYTPMEFVVEVLTHVFYMDNNTATRVMLDVHTKGKGVCGVYSYEIAETRVAQVTKLAQENQHPLLCVMEED